MKKYFQKSVMATAIALAGSLYLPNIATAGAPSVAATVGTNGWGPLAATIDLNQLPACDISHYVVPDTFDAGSARAPVWTEKLGEVDLDQYTREELSQMVLDFWTPERIRNTIPLDLPSPDGVHRSLVGGAEEPSGVISVRAPVWTDELGEVDLDQYTREELAQMVRDYWTPERIRNTIPLDLPSPDGVQRSLTGDADMDPHFRAPFLPDEEWGGPNQYTNEELAQKMRDFWTPERIRNATPDELVSYAEQYRALTGDKSAEACVFPGSGPAVAE